MGSLGERGAGAALLSVSFLARTGPHSEEPSAFESTSHSAAETLLSLHSRRLSPPRTLSTHLFSESHNLNEGILPAMILQKMHCGGTQCECANEQWCELIGWLGDMQAERQRPLGGNRTNVVIGMRGRHLRKRSRRS